MLAIKLSEMERMGDWNNYYIFFIILAILVFCFNPGNSWAKVEGICSNCHTMHNSQDDDLMARIGTGVGWDVDSELTGGNPSSPLSNLLRTDCVGCHSSTTSDTIIAVAGGSDIPIVYNTSEPTNPLAGGNFYWIAHDEDDSLGHNVYGISEGDKALTTKAPGLTDTPCGNSCHTSLALPPGNNNSNKTGCEGCHVFVAHHDDERQWYRFLKGHSVNPSLPFASSAIDGDDYVLRTPKSEDNDWEFTSSSDDHNFYKGTDKEYTSDKYSLRRENTITAFCSGCHGAFHGPEEFGGELGMGSTSPWIRHPTDILLPNTSEYAGYDPVNNYSVEAPVAWLDPENPVRGEAVVMCLSCHRAHGSNQPDLLRWDYTGMIAGGDGSGGCFVCHTTKD